MLHSIIIPNEQDWEENMRNYLLELMWYYNKSYIQLRRVPTRHDNIYRFQTYYNKDVRYPSSHYLSIVTADKGYDSEEGNHILVREQLHAFSMIWTCPPDIDMMYQYGRHMEDIWKIQETDKWSVASKTLYNQRNKEETIISVIKKDYLENKLHQDW